MYLLRFIGPISTLLFTQPKWWPVIASKKKKKYYNNAILKLTLVKYNFNTSTLLELQQYWECKTYPHDALDPNNKYSWF